MIKILKTLTISLLILLLLPLLIFLLLYFCSFLFMGKPVIFKQERAAKHGKPFYIYKFRTMTEDKDSSGNLLPSYERVTGYGQFLRKTSLDEIPQIINLIKGDLSLVGPRPLHVEYNTLYNSSQRKRLNVKPGVTGLAQINGRNNISWEEKFKLDVYYVENKSFWFDLKILYKTIKKVLLKVDINPDEKKETPRFKGESNE